MRVPNGPKHARGTLSRLPGRQPAPRVIWKSRLAHAGNRRKNRDALDKNLTSDYTLYKSAIGFIESIIAGNRISVKSLLERESAAVNEELKMQIRRMNQRIKELGSIYHTAANQIGVSDGEIAVWSALLTAEQDYSQQELCDLLSLPRQTVNSVISKMVKKGFVYLEHIPGTRNQKTIHLTQQGRDFGRDQVQWIFQAEERALERADPRQVQICIEMIETFTRHLRKELNLPKEGTETL